MKCISLWQPWASLMALGLKRIETRHWFTEYQGPIAIHAAKSLKGEGDWVDMLADELLPPDFPPFRGLPFGAIVAVGDLVGWERFTDYHSQTKANLRTAGRIYRITREEFYFGDLSEGRYGWLFENVRPLAEPLPLIGRQGLFNLSPEVAAEVLRLARTSTAPPVEGV